METGLVRKTLRGSELTLRQTDTEKQTWYGVGWQRGSVQVDQITGWKLQSGHEGKSRTTGKASETNT